MSKRMWIYLIGKVGDLTDDRYYDSVKVKFENRAIQLRELGYVVINPMDLCDRDMDWDLAMRRCLNGMLQCDYISTLNDYTESRGGMIEYRLACMLGYENILPSSINNLI